MSAHGVCECVCVCVYFPSIFLIQLVHICNKLYLSKLDQITINFSKYLMFLMLKICNLLWISLIFLCLIYH